MAQTQELKNKLKEGFYDDKFLDIYADKNRAMLQKERYQNAISQFEQLYGTSEVSVFSAPGRSEVGGNHTDHQHGEILAASINLDAVAVVKKTEDKKVSIKSDGYDLFTVSLEDLSHNEKEEGTTLSLVKGVLHGFLERGLKIGGFAAYVTSDVLIGAGLSSSASFEVLIGTILSDLYNDGKVDSVTVAIIGQYAENVYFGKPCGLMDQMACAVGSLVHVDFKDPKKPVVNKVSFDMNAYGYSLCITDTKGSHVDLTPDYAAVPSEMRQVAAFFYQEVLRGITMEKLLENIPALRSKVSDRAILRAIHFVEENERVEKEVAALKEGNISKFLEHVKASGNSSYKYLQNVYTNTDVFHQNVSLALCVSEYILGDDGVCRVHGGGFAGTIQAFVKNEKVEAYVSRMENIFGLGACQVLKIRKYGGIKVID